eukprot:snap_masked-scaffold_103-processed-gene-0.27-mRNA-1 protein AED:1.00 eAED:1.00 QI:0/0/0/0/1/1/3/0/268
MYSFVYFSEIEYKYYTTLTEIKSFLRENGVWKRVSSNIEGDELSTTKKGERPQVVLDAVATRIIYEHLSEKVIEAAGDIEDSHTLWTKIKTLYSADDKSERNRLYSQLIKSPGTTAMERLNNFDTNQKRYRDIDGRLNEEDKITMILCIIRKPLVNNLEQHLRLHEHLRKYDIVLKEMRFIAEKIDSRSNKPKPKNNNNVGNYQSLAYFAPDVVAKDICKTTVSQKTFALSAAVNHTLYHSARKTSRKKRQDRCRRATRPVSKLTAFI